ncbi:MAG: lipoyl(octanoyl) transferase LipB [Pseudomarimonas sp.]
MDNLADTSTCVAGAESSRATTAPTQWWVRDLGRQPYEPVWRAMQTFTDQRDESSTDELWLLEHDPVFTLGQAGKPEHILAAGDIPVIHVDRGGQVTYHGPGQLVAYPLLDLRRLRIGVRELVDRVEQAVIDTLGIWNIPASRKCGAPGVYVGAAKVMALGLRVRRGCSFHGLALNIDMDLTPYQRINPCGFEGLQVTQLLDLGGPGSRASVSAALVSALSRQFSLQPSLVPTSLPCAASA